MKKIKLIITKEENIYTIVHIDKTLSIHKNIFGVLFYLRKKLKKLEETNYGT